MEFGLSEEQTILKNEVRRFLQNECTTDFVKEMIEDEKGYSPLMWKKMAELGWMGVLFEERYGGNGGTFSDLSIILEEMGRFLLPGPFFSTVILGGVTILEGNNEELKQRVLPGIASGDIIMTLALTEEGGSYSIEEINCKGELRSDGFLLKGRKMFVPDAHIADYLICPVGTSPKGNKDGDISLFLVEAKNKGIGLMQLITLDLRKQYEVILTDVHVLRDHIVGQEGMG
jgi:alkylation response protein AidB-like acyl-CoA dehydrogenase